MWEHQPLHELQPPLLGVWERKREGERERGREREREESLDDCVGRKRKGEKTFWMIFTTGLTENVSANRSR
jgi:hypothetical protein